MITGIDHIALVVRDLDAAVADYRALLGREPNWRGALDGAQHAWFQIPNTGLDLIAPLKASRFGKSARERLEAGGEGILAIGFAVRSLEDASRTVARRGIAVAAQTELTSVDQSGVERSWRYANLASGLPTFLVQAAESEWPVSSATEESAVEGLDHVVIRTANPDRAAAVYGARLGLDLRLDRSNPQWHSRLQFFRCGDAILEIASRLDTPTDDANDSFGGLAWRINDAPAIRERLERSGFDVSQLRDGRKPGTRVFTVRSRTAGVPTLMLESSAVRPGKSESNLNPAAA